MPNTLTIELPFGLDPEEARLLLTMKLFEEGRVSLGYAAEMAGYSKRTYIELLGKHGIPAFNYTVEEFEQELETLEQLQAELQAERTARQMPTSDSK
jgi:predicted HTH domain antitoxin